MGRKVGENTELPCRVHNLRRPIPRKNPCAKLALLFFAGLIPFGCMFVELYFLFTSMWSYHKLHFAWTFLLVVFLLVFVVASCVSITSTYILLSLEDHRWAWHAL